MGLTSLVPRVSELGFRAMAKAASLSESTNSFATNVGQEIGGSAVCRKAD
jgi:hypothetical protein